MNERRGIFPSERPDASELDAAPRRTKIPVRYVVLGIIVALAWASWSAKHAPPPAIANVAPQSLLVISLDTTRRDAMGFLRDGPGLGAEPPPSRTPTLDALAAESIVFEDAYTVTPLTLPAHTSLMTGLYPASHHLRDNGVGALASDATTLAEVLKGAGFTTRAAVAAFVLASSFGLDQGFDRYSDVPRDPRSQSLFMSERRADVMVDQALADFGQMSAPYFYWLHLFDAHFPYEAPGSTPGTVTDEASIQREKRRLYGEEISFLDRQLARLFEALRKRPDWNQLLVVVVADHGESLGDGIEPTHGWFLYDPTVRIPFVLRIPGHAPQRIATPVSLVDVMPTALDLLGVKRPDLRFDGQTLAPLIWSENSDLLSDRVLALESWYAYANFGWAPLDGCVFGDWKYLRSKRERLFDRAHDAGEKNDLSAAEPQRTARLRDRLVDRFSQLAGDFAARSIVVDDAMRKQLLKVGYIEPSASRFEDRPDAAALEDAEDHVDVVWGLETINSAFFDGHVEEAAAMLRKLCGLAPNAPYAHETLASMLLTMRKPELLDEAEHHLRESARLDFHRSKTHFNLGLVAMRRAGLTRDKAEASKQRRSACDEFRLTLEVDSESPQALANLGALLAIEAGVLPAGQETERIALLDEAHSSLKRFLEVVPADHPDRAGMQKHVEELENALAEAAAAASGGKKDPK